MNKAVSEKDWIDAINEKINAFSKDLESERLFKKELMSALELLHGSVRSIWDSVIELERRIVMLEKETESLKSDSINRKRWWTWR